MTCIKTGAHIFNEPHNLYLYGDAHMDSFEEVYIFRVCAISLTPLQSTLHFTVHNYDYFFDEEVAEKRKGNATMICPNIAVDNHGYEGKKI